MYNLRIVQREIEGPESVERTLLLDEEPIAVAFIDPEQREATLVWPTDEEITLRNVIDSFFENYIRKSSFYPEGLVLQFRLDDEYYESILYSDVTAQEILSAIDEQADKPLESMELLDISVGSTTLEVVFDQQSLHPNILALLMPSIDMQRLIEFFSRLHKNKKVRSDTTVAAAAFHPRTPLYRTEGLNMLFPLAIIEGNERKSVVKELPVSEEVGEDM